MAKKKAKKKTVKKKPAAKRKPSPKKITPAPEPFSEVTEAEEIGDNEGEYQDDTQMSLPFGQ